MRYSKQALSLVMLAATSASLGCTSTYRPRPGPRLSIVLENGNPVLVKQGNRYHPGMFGSGLVDAVNGNPAAEERASTFRSLTIGGFAVSLLGAGVVGASAGVLAYDAASNDADSRLGIALGLAIGGLAVMLVGGGLTTAAQVHYWDAINIYNDSVDPVWAPVPQPMFQPGMMPAPYGPRPPAPMYPQQPAAPPPAMPPAYPPPSSMPPAAPTFPALPASAAPLPATPGPLN